MSSQQDTSTEQTGGCCGAGSPEPSAHTLMFWMLIVLAACAFVPVVLGPAWQDRTAWERKEAALAAEVAALQARRDRNQAIIDALLADPAAGARLAARELGFTRPGEKLVRFEDECEPALPSYAKPTDPASLGTSPGRPSVPSAAPSGYWSRILSNPVFVASPTRELLLGMAGVLTVAAFWLYRRP